MNSLFHRAKLTVLKRPSFSVRYPIEKSPSNFNSPLIWAFSSMNDQSTPTPDLFFLSDSSSRFEEVKSLLDGAGFAESHCIYQLDSRRAETRFWKENCRLLIVPGDDDDGGGGVSNDVRSRIEEYLSAKGSVLSFSRSLFQTGLASLEGPVINGPVVVYDRTFDTVMTEFHPNMEKSSDDLAANDPSHLPLIRCLSSPDGGKLVVSGIPLLTKFDKVRPAVMGNHEAILSLVLERYFEVRRDDVVVAPKWTPIFLMADNPPGLSKNFSEILRDLDTSGKLVNLSVVVDEEHLKVAPKDKITVVLRSDRALAFDSKTYRRHLASRFFAQIVMYADVLPTTMTILDCVLPFIPRHHLPPIDPSAVIVVASRQSSGRGRGGNAWLSPLGCAMFTLHLNLSMDKELGRRVSMVQHLAALAVVEAVVERSGYEAVDARIKWPNDLLHGKTRAKLGGILVKSSVMGVNVRCVVGCGVNLSNGEPTTCLNDLAMESRRSSSTPSMVGEEADLLMSREEFIARVVSKLESIVSDFEEPEKRAKILRRYYRHWLHGDQPVTVNDGGGGEPLLATVIGIDEFGFLKAVTKTDGRVRELTLHPDGNSFDLFRNLIVAK